jgi:hypothetical protein
MPSETTKLTRADLLAPEDYAARRRELRAQVLEYRRHRTLALGPFLTLAFENRHTIRYQVQEMLRIERIVEPAAIQAELDACNPLIPDGSNWKASCFIKYPDERAQREALVRLRGIERHLWVQVAEFPRVSAVADEDPGRPDGDTTTAVHFLRFELGALQVAALKADAGVRFGVDHPQYSHAVVAPPEVRAALRADLA